LQRLKRVKYEKENDFIIVGSMLYVDNERSDGIEKGV
jgi:hypothetical protein